MGDPGGRLSWEVRDRGHRCLEKCIQIWVSRVWESPLSVRKTYTVICNVEAMSTFCVSAACVVVSAMKAFQIYSWCKNSPESHISPLARFGNRPLFALIPLWL